MRSTPPLSLTRLTLVLTALGGVLAGGCADEGPGSIVVPVQLGNNKSCDDVGVAQLRATLDRKGEIYEETVDCSVGEVRLSDVPAQRYDLLVQGLAADGVAIMDNLDNDEMVVEVVGDGATVELEPVLITDAPAQLRVGWDFGLSNCASADIAQFDITAYETGGTSVLVQSSIDCDAPTDSGNLHLVPDPDRTIKGNLVGEASIQPVDSSGSGVGTAVDFEFPAPGAGRPVDLILECDASGCTPP